MNILDPIPRITDWIIRHARKTPYFHIDNSDGRYMNRWWVFNPDWVHCEKKLFGLRLLAWLPAIRLHHTVKSDEERHMHDHPRHCISVLLRGQYFEVMPTDQGQSAVLDGIPFHRQVKLRLPLRPIFRKSTSRHRLAVRDKQGVWSLFIMFGPKRKWGFHTEDGWVYYRDYLGLDK